MRDNMRETTAMNKIPVAAAAAAAVTQPVQPAVPWPSPACHRLGWLGHRCRRCCRYCGIYS